MGAKEYLYSVRKAECDIEAEWLAESIRCSFDLENLEKILIADRFELHSISTTTMDAVKTTILSEPQCDQLYADLSKLNAERVLIDGEDDVDNIRRSSKFEKCVEMMTGERVRIRIAKVYLFFGMIADTEFARIESLFTGNTGNTPSVTERDLIALIAKIRRKSRVQTAPIGGVEIADDRVKKAFNRYLELRKTAYGDFADDRTKDPFSVDEILTISNFGLHTETDKMKRFCLKTTGGNENAPWLTMQTVFSSDGDGIAAASAAAIASGANDFRAMRISCAGEPNSFRNAEKAANSATNIGISTGLVQEFYHNGYGELRPEFSATIGICGAKMDENCPKPGDTVYLTAITPDEKCRLRRMMKKTGGTLKCFDGGVLGFLFEVSDKNIGASVDFDAFFSAFDRDYDLSKCQCGVAILVSVERENEFCGLASENGLTVRKIAKIGKTNAIFVKIGQQEFDITECFKLNNETISFSVPKMGRCTPENTDLPAERRLIKMAESYDFCSQRGLGEYFDATAGGVSLLHPFGGVNQLTPAQVMATKLGEKSKCVSVMSFGFEPKLSEVDAYFGAEASVVESVAKLVAAGCGGEKVVAVQGLFSDSDTHEDRVFSSALGVMNATTELGAGILDAKFVTDDDPSIPPTVVCFATANGECENVISSEFKGAGNPVYLFGAVENDGEIDYDALKTAWQKYLEICTKGKVLSAWAIGRGGAAEAIIKMSVGNNVCFKYTGNDPNALFEPQIGSILCECTGFVQGGKLIGHTNVSGEISLQGAVTLNMLCEKWEKPLEFVYPTRAGSTARVRRIDYSLTTAAKAVGNLARPLALIPAFPGMTDEEETANAVERAGGEAKIFVISDLSSESFEQYAARFADEMGKAQMMILPGGDETNVATAFAAAFFRSPRVSESIEKLLETQDGLMLGIGSGFHTLIRLGLLPNGKISEVAQTAPVLIQNAIGRHQSCYAMTRIISQKSPWLNLCVPGYTYNVPMSFGVGRFVAPEYTLNQLEENGQVATQFVDLVGEPTMDVRFNPGGSMRAIEGIISRDGRILGKLGHCERYSADVAKNIYGNKFQPLFESGVNYFK